MATENSEPTVLSLYFADRIDREEAIERVGRATVERAERERTVVENDVEWGTSE